MRYLNPNLNLFINGLQFKAYLEESENLYEPKDQQLPFVPTSFVNDSIAIRVMERVKFAFNVFSENESECNTNYTNLKRLLNIIKPSYYETGDLLIPDQKNLSGFISISFAGMPINKTAKIHLTNFSYSVNKDVGYIYIDSSGRKDLVPLAYKINIEGRVIKEFNETANVKKVELSKRAGRYTDKSKPAGYDELLKDNKFRNLLAKYGTSLELLDADTADAVMTAYTAGRDSVTPDGGAVVATSQDRKRHQEMNEAILTALESN